MEIKINGIKCDCCGWEDDTIVFEEYKKFIDADCPNCGSILLTKEEYNKYLRIYKYVKYYNILSNMFKWISPIYYYRLIFGDKRKRYKTIIEWPKRKIFHENK